MKGFGADQERLKYLRSKLEEVKREKAKGNNINLTGDERFASHILGAMNRDASNQDMDMTNNDKGAKTELEIATYAAENGLTDEQARAELGYGVVPRMGDVKGRLDSAIAEVKSKKPMTKDQQEKLAN
jgi:hypothetical protein